MLRFTQTAPTLPNLYPSRTHARKVHHIRIRGRIDPLAMLVPVWTTLSEYGCAILDAARSPHADQHPRRPGSRCCGQNR